MIAQKDRPLKPCQDCSALLSFEHTLGWYHVGMVGEDASWVHCPSRGEPRPLVS